MECVVQKSGSAQEWRGLYLVLIMPDGCQPQCALVCTVVYDRLTLEKVSVTHGHPSPSLGWFLRQLSSLYFRAVFLGVVRMHVANMLSACTACFMGM